MEEVDISYQEITFVNIYSPQHRSTHILKANNNKCKGRNRKQYNIRGLQYSIHQWVDQLDKKKGNTTLKSTLDQIDSTYVQHSASQSNRIYILLKVTCNILQNK